MVDAIHVYNKQGDIVAWATRDCVTGEVRLATQCDNDRRRVDTLGSCHGNSNWDAVCNALQQLQEALERSCSN